MWGHKITKNIKKAEQKKKKQNVLCNKDLTIGLRTTLLRCYLFSDALLYRVEASRLKQSIADKWERYVVKNDQWL